MLGIRKASAGFGMDLDSRVCCRAMRLDSRNTEQKDSPKQAEYNWVRNDYCTPHKIGNIENESETAVLFVVSKKFPESADW